MTVHYRCYIIALMTTVNAHAWPGHDWQKWKEITTWTRPDVTSDQAGSRELVPVLSIRGQTSTAIDEIKAWEQKRTLISRTLQHIMGESTGLRPEPPVVDLLGEETLPDHLRRHVRIRSEQDDWIPAYLLLPKNTSDVPRPAMICLHQTVAQGKEEPCGMRGSPDLAFGLELVRRGFVCIAPDAIGFGERIPPGSQPYHDSLAFYRRHPRWSFMSKMIWDLSRVVDYLETLDRVDRLQIGCIGHSHGAYGAIFAGAFEPRISLVIASCGFTTLRADPTPERWSHLTPLIPQLGTYLPDVASIPFDWPQILALMAPRPLFVWYATQDTIFPHTDNLDAVLRDVRTAYRLYGAGNELAWKTFDGAHSFPPHGRSQAYRWLQERFFPVGDLHPVPADLKTWKQKRELVQRVIMRTLGQPVEDQTSLHLETLAVEHLPRYERRLIEYHGDGGDRIRAYLCIPRQAASPEPGVLVLHQTVKQGKRESVGLEGSPTLAFGSDLAERGYVTLSPDSITAGERVDKYGPFDTRGHYLRHGTQSAMGKMLFDARQGLQVLRETRQVDPARLGAIGHSLGAEEALMLAAFSPEVRATVASCGFATFKADKEPLRWARDHWFSYMPTLRPVFLQGRQPHWDWDHVIGLVAPRALYLHNTLNDEIFTESVSAYQAGEAARASWKLHDQGERLTNVLKPGKHGIAPETLKEIYAWLDRELASIPKPINERK
ncbi:MAG TPA: alpha/beta fold hydrolase [Phycisphaerae bacterium]|nr:alpha/beta fold hydrolase [Phycisphaerae bacterium]HRY66610.1 alpha/beta fold hydrolase [Phycisphaerae bacterium]HSA27030.1 alpha/beta fold hydrolase [Phycisphaerae bacterium]